MPFDIWNILVDKILRLGPIPSNTAAVDAANIAMASLGGKRTLGPLRSASSTQSV